MESTTPYMDELISNEIRKDALAWWRGMTKEAQVSQTCTWKFMTTSDSLKKNTFQIIAVSDFIIERIYRELILEENFDN